MPSITLYLPLDHDRELMITLQTREFDGISSDPHVTTREPTFSEVLHATQHIKRFPVLFQDYTSLNFPEKS